MQKVDGKLLLSASDLVAFLACEHLAALDLQVVNGDRPAAAARSAASDLAARKGGEHERRYLESLIGRALTVAIVPQANGHGNRAGALEETVAAMRAGVDVVYQAALADGTWRGYADFLERVPVPSPVLGDWSYEVADTKLARHAKPEYIVQLCLYSALVGNVQGRRPERMHLVLGGGERQTFRLDDFAAVSRRLRDRYNGRLGEAFAGTYPEPVAHCAFCRWSEQCQATWKADDHLTLVAGLGRAQATRLMDAGITTCAQLARAAGAQRPSGMGQPTFDRLVAQANLQVAERTTGRQSYELLPPEEVRGFGRLPEPRPGDLYFDMESDPFYEDEGLEYLFGVSHIEDGEAMFRAFWARDRTEEKLAFETFIDYVIAALERDPAIHVYHYAPYEPAALKRLMGRHGTREDEVDRLLRGKVLVDLYAVTIQALRTSKPGYSIKQIEAFYMGPREEEVTDGGDSIVRFEEWLDTGEQALLDAIEAYNEVDCESTIGLHRWLLDRREEAQRQFRVPIPWRPPPEAKEPTPEAEEARDELTRLCGALTCGLPEDLSNASEEQHARWLMAQLLHYHRREEKPTWWAYFARLESSPEELVEDSEAIGQLTTDLATQPVPDARSLIYTLRFAEQQHKLSPGDGVVDPATERAVDIVGLDDTRGRLCIRRGQYRAGEPLPESLIPGGPYNTNGQRAALRRFAQMLLDATPGEPPTARALYDILLARPPRIRNRAPGQPVTKVPLEMGQLTEQTLRLEDSYLFIQGPPGSGKTWTGGQLIVSLMEAGARVGVAANSHKAIHNLLHEVEETAAARSFKFQGWKKCSSENPDSHYTSRLQSPLIVNEPSIKSFPPPSSVQLVAGTAWLFAPEPMDATLDYLVIDEAGQVSLADALAMGTSAHNLILLGDPLQLAQVTQGTHPDGAGCSVLEHLLGPHDTIPSDMGVFLDRTRRMHPDVCQFVSDAFYEGRLDALEELSQQRIDAPCALTGTGMRFIAVPHEGNTTSSAEEVDAIAAAIRELEGATLTPTDGLERPLTLEDIMVVAPYNAQVRRLTEGLPAGVRIGTVDKFQGQEAQVVFFSMATSSGEDVPRNVEFLYSRNRLNVAVSRARCLAVLVCSPRLLDLQPRSLEQMRLVNALCRLAEAADTPARPWTPTP